MKNIISKLAVVLSLSFILCGSSMASDHFFYANKYNSAGTSTTVMSLISDHVCALSQVSIEETDTGSEEATCRVSKSGAVWILEARLDKSSDADAECAAICFDR